MSAKFEDVPENVRDVECPSHIPVECLSAPFTLQNALAFDTEVILEEGLVQAAAYPGRLWHPFRMCAPVKIRRSQTLVVGTAYRGVRLGDAYENHEEILALGHSHDVSQHSVGVVCRAALEVTPCSPTVADGDNDRLAERLDVEGREELLGDPVVERRLALSKAPGELEISARAMMYDRGQAVQASELGIRRE